MSTKFIGPDGKPYVFDGTPEELANAKAQGFRVADEISPVESAIDSAKATALGAVQGATAGLFGAGVGADQGDTETPENAQARWSLASEMHRLGEEHPIASGAGELGGAIVSPINKLTPMLEGERAASAVGRIAQKAGSNAVIGGLYGAGNAMSEAALGNTDLNAEKLIASAGLGSVLGGLGGGVVGSIEEGAAKVLPKLSKLIGGSQSALDDVANEATIKATRAQQSVINKLGDDKVAAAAEAVRSRGHLKMTPDEMAESISKDREGIGKILGKFLDDADAAGAKPDHMRMLNRLDEFEAGLNDIEKGVISKDLGDARRAVAKLGANDEGFRALDDLKKTIQERAKFSRGPTPLDDTTLRLKRGLAGTFRDELDQQLLPQLGSDGAKAFTEHKALYGALKDAERLADSGAKRVGNGALGGFGLRDVLWGVAGAGVHPLGIAAALGSKVMREYGPAIVAKVADRLSKSPALQTAAKSFAATLPGKLPQLGEYGATLAQAALRGPESALAAHMVMARLEPGYAANAQMAGLTPETPDEHVAALSKASSLAATKAAIDEHDKEVKAHVDRVAGGTSGQHIAGELKGQDFGAQRMRQSPLDGHKTRVDEIRQLAADPQALIDRTSKNLQQFGAIAPATSAAMTVAAHRAVSYLAQASAVPPKAGPLAPEWHVSDAERFAFAQKLEVIQEPMSILKSAMSGTLCDEQMEALRAVYPGLAKQISDAALERMVSAKGSVPYKSRIMLSMLSGVDPDGSLSPGAIAANQTAIASAGNGKSGEPGAPGAPDAKADAGSIKLAERMAMPGQRREVRENDA